MDMSIKVDRAIQAYTKRVKAAIFTLQLNRINPFPSITKKKEVEN